MIDKKGKRTDEKLRIAGVGLTGTRRERVIEELERCLLGKGGFGEAKGQKGMVMVVTPNPEQIVQAQDDEVFRCVLNESEYSVPDGVGLVIAKRLLGIKYKELRIKQINRIAGIDLAEELVGICGGKELKVMIVGGREGVAEEAGRRVSNGESGISNNEYRITNHKSRITDLGDNKRNSKFEIRGLSGAVDIAHETQQEREETLQKISEFRPHLLLVAYGAPWQEKWVAANREELEKAGVRVAMVVGGAVDVWAGRVRRAPGLVRRVGMEWLWRLVVEPWRWRRQLRLVRFGGLVVRQIFHTNSLET